MNMKSITLMLMLVISVAIGATIPTQDDVLGPNQHPEQEVVEDEYETEATQATQEEIDAIPDWKQSNVPHTYPEGQWTTSFDGPVEVSPDFVKLDEQDHHHIQILSLPDNEIDDQDPLYHMQEHMVNKHIQDQNNDIQDRAPSGVDDSEAEDIQDVDSRSKDGMLHKPRSGIKNLILPNSKSVETDEKNGIHRIGSIKGNFRLSAWFVKKYKVRVGSTFSIPKGIFEVAKLTKDEAGDSFTAQTVRRGLLRLLKRAKFTAEYQGPIKRHKRQGDKRWKSTKIDQKKGLEKLQKLQQQLSEDVDENKRDEVVNFALKKAHLLIHKHFAKIAPSLDRHPRMFHQWIKLHRKVSKKTISRLRSLLARHHLNHGTKEMKKRVSEEVRDTFFRTASSYFRSAYNRVSKISVSGILSAAASGTRRFFTAAASGFKTLVSGVLNFASWALGKLGSVLVALKDGVKVLVKTALTGSSQWNLEERLFTAGADFSGRVLYEKNLSHEGAGANARLRVQLGTAKVELFPKLTMQGHIENYRILSFKSLIGGHFTFILNVLANLKGNIQKRYQSPEPLYKADLGNLKFNVGDIPIYIDAKFSVKAGFNVNGKLTAQVETGVELRTGLSLGVEKSGGKWRGVWKPYWKRKFNKPTITACASLNAEFWLTPVVDIKMYGTTGPKFRFEPYVNVDFIANGVPQCGQPRSGATSSFGAWGTKVLPSSGTSTPSKGWDDMFKPKAPSTPGTGFSFGKIVRTAIKYAPAVIREAPGALKTWKDVKSGKSSWVDGTTKGLTIASKVLAPPPAKKSFWSTKSPSTPKTSSGWTTTVRPATPPTYNGGWTATVAPAPAAPKPITKKSFWGNVRDSPDGEYSALVDSDNDEPEGVDDMDNDDGTYDTFNEYATKDNIPSRWVVSAGVRGFVLMKMKFLGHMLGDFSKALQDQKYTLAEGCVFTSCRQGVQLGLPPKSFAPPNSNLNAPFTGQVHDENYSSDQDEQVQDHDQNQCSMDHSTFEEFMADQQDQDQSDEDSDDMQDDDVDEDVQDFFWSRTTAKTPSPAPAPTRPAPYRSSYRSSYRSYTPYRPTTYTSYRATRPSSSSSVTSDEQAALQILQQKDASPALRELSKAMSQASQTKNAAAKVESDIVKYHLQKVPGAATLLKQCVEGKKIAGDVEAKDREMRAKMQKLVEASQKLQSGSSSSSPSYSPAPAPKKAAKKSFW